MINVLVRKKVFAHHIDFPYSLKKAGQAGITRNGVMFQVMKNGRSCWRMNCLNSFAGSTSKVFGDGSEFVEEQNEQSLFFSYREKTSIMCDKRITFQ
jgi:hypothetical protein